MVQTAVYMRANVQGVFIHFFFSLYELNSSSSGCLCTIAVQTAKEKTYTRSPKEVNPYLPFHGHKFTIRPHLIPLSFFFYTQILYDWMLWWIDFSNFVFVIQLVMHPDRRSNDIFFKKTKKQKRFTTNFCFLLLNKPCRCIDSEHSIIHRHTPSHKMHDQKKTKQRNCETQESQITETNLHTRT